MNGTVVPKIWDVVVAYYYQHYSNVIERMFTENGHPVPQYQTEAEKPVEQPQPTVL